MEIDNKIIIFLSLIDSLHDFDNLDTTKKCFKLLITFYNHIQNNILLDEIFNTDGIKDIILLTKDINDNKIRELVKKFIFTHIKRTGKNINDLHIQIIEDFNNVFNVNLDGFINFNSSFNLNTLLSDKQKILLRQTLYFLIHGKAANYDESIIDFILDYMNINKNIYSDNVIESIKKQIKYNLETNKFNHVTYPITYFSDTAEGITHNTFHFNIINLDKDKIDAAKVSTPITQFKNYEKNKFNNQLFIDDYKHILGFTVERNKDKISLLGFDFYLENNFITCSHDDIKLVIKKNSVGRNSKKDNDNINEDTINNGIYQITLSLLLIFNKIFERINNKQLTYLQTKINEMEQYNQEIRNTIKDLMIQIRKFKEIDFMKINDRTIMIALLQIYTSRQKYSQTLINEHKTKINKIRIKISRIEQINDFNENNIFEINLFIDEFNSLIHFFNLLDSKIEITKISKINYNNYYYLLSSFNNTITDNKINFNNNGILLLLFDEIYNIKDKLIDFFNIDTLYIQLYNIYKKYLSLELCQGCIIFMMFGYKRFGDWIQVYLSNKFYFILETIDFYCKLYSYLIGAPVIFDNMIYNYDLIKIKPEINKDLFKIINDENKLSNYNHESSILYSSLRNIPTNSISRVYFNKYIKYKNKYLELKNNYK
jgi:hypothetical protein